MSFFKKIGKTVKKVTKPITKTAGKVLKTAAPIASMVPGLGTVVGAAAGVVGDVLSPDKQAKIDDAVERDNYVDVAKIEDTIVKNNPSVDTSTLVAATSEMTQKAIESNPTATIKDDNAVTKVNTGTKVMQFIKKYFVWIGAGLLGVLFLTKGGKSRRKSW